MLTLVAACTAFVLPLQQSRLHLRAAGIQASIERQMDTGGRGQQHLSAGLQEGDVVAYQVGTWLVDNVEVGDDEPARLEYARVEFLQLVWTNDCEHGYIHATALSYDGDRTMAVVEDEDIQFGPEQLVARCQATWDDDSGSATLAEPLPPEESLLHVV